MPEGKTCKNCGFKGVGYKGVIDAETGLCDECLVQKKRIEASADSRYKNVNIYEIK